MRASEGVPSAPNQHDAHRHALDPGLEGRSPLGWPGDPVPERGGAHEMRCELSEPLDRGRLVQLAVVEGEAADHERGLRHDHAEHVLDAEGLEPHLQSDVSRSRASGTISCPRRLAVPPSSRRAGW